MLAATSRFTHADPAARGIAECGILYTRINDSSCRIAVLENTDTISGVVTPARYIDYYSVNRLLIDSA